MAGLTAIEGLKPIEPTSFSITLEESQKLYDREFEELMKLPKCELVKRLIGERP